MKTRQIEILKYILSDTEVGVDHMCDLYDISKRTFYYDLEFINSEISSYGLIKNVHGNLIFFGDKVLLVDELDEKLLNPFYQSKERQDIIYYSLLMDGNLTIEDLADTLGVSKTTVFSDISTMKAELFNIGIELDYRNGYLITGNEWVIRDQFISLIENNLNLLSSISQYVSSLNKNHELKLTDYSLTRFEILSNLVRYRIANNSVLENFDTGIIPSPKERRDLSILIGSDNEAEIRYILTYLLSLSSTRNFDKSEYITNFINDLNQKVEVNFALKIDDEHFRTNLRNHLMASRLRIKHKFPAVNPSLRDIKLKYSNLFKTIKRIILFDLNYSDFMGMRDEEIGFIAAYYGGYFKSLETTTIPIAKVLLVCPHGLSVSTQLEIQIKRLLPNIMIIGSYSINDLSINLLKDYDFVISTIHIPSISNLIVVNAVLSNTDQIKLLSAFGQSSRDTSLISVESVLEVIREHTVILDEEKLSRKLLELLATKKKGGDKMLSELLLSEMIAITDETMDWKEAIRRASQPLLDRNKIESDYIVDMINSIDNHGPYIVLADLFALPHASGTKSVHELSMSMLQLKEPIDMLGKSVKVFVVLATPDTNSHLRALSTLSEILMDEDNLNTFVYGDKQAVLDLIKQTEEDEV